MSKMFLLLGLLAFYIGFIWTVFKMYRKFHKGVEYRHLDPETRARMLAEYDRYQMIRGLDRIEENIRRDDFHRFK